MNVLENSITEYITDNQSPNTSEARNTLVEQSISVTLPDEEILHDLISTIDAGIEKHLNDLNEVKKHLENLKKISSFLNNIKSKMSNVIQVNDDIEKSTHEANKVLKELEENHSLLNATKTQINDLLCRKPKVQCADQLKAELEGVADCWKKIYNFSKEICIFLTMCDELNSFLNENARMVDYLDKPVSEVDKVAVEQLKKMILSKFFQQKTVFNNLLAIRKSSADNQLFETKFQTILGKWNECASVLNQPVVVYIDSNEGEKNKNSNDDELNQKNQANQQTMNQQSKNLQHLKSVSPITSNPQTSQPNSNQSQPPQTSHQQKQTQSSFGPQNQSYQNNI